MRGDGVHPKAAGAELIARQVARTMLKRFADGAPPPLEPVEAPLEYNDPIMPGVSVPYLAESVTRSGQAAHSPLLLASLPPHAPRSPLPLA